MSSRLLKTVIIVAGGTILGVGVFAATRPPLTTPTTVALVAVPPETTTTTLPATTTTEPRGWLVIQGVGDVNTDPNYIPAFVAQGYEIAFSGLDGLFHEDDLTVINLECSPSQSGSPSPKPFVFQCDEDSLPVIAGAGVEVANLGNNHGQDYGKEAMLRGRENLIANGIAPVGVGADAAEAGAPAVFEINGWQVAVIGFGGVYPGLDWFATGDRAGMRNGDDIPSMVEAVRAAKEVADIVVVTIHWGVELDLVPRPEDVERARAMIDAGADIIFGHHPHRLQALEIVDGRPVAWSLGNFVWPNFSRTGSTTAIARVVVSPNGEFDACLIPAFITSPGHPETTGEPPCAPRE